MSMEKLLHMKSIAPNIFVRDMNKTIEYYQHLGFEVAMKVPEEGDVVWAMLSCGSVNFMFQSFESLGEELPEISRQDGGSLLLYIQTKEIVLFHDRIKNKVNIIKGLEKTFYGATEFSIQDINGYILTFAEQNK